MSILDRLLCLCVALLRELPACGISPMSVCLSFAGEKHCLTTACCPVFMDVENLGSRIKQQPLNTDFLNVKCVLNCLLLLL